MRWNGHVLIMNKRRSTKKILNMKVKGKRPRGRPWSRWEQKVKKDVTQME